MTEYYMEGRTFRHGPFETLFELARSVNVVTSLLAEYVERGEQVGAYPLSFRAREGCEERFLTAREWKELHAFVGEHGVTELVDFHGPLGGEQEE